jgi:hypothetical protein
LRKAGDVKDSELEWFRPLWLRIVVTGFVALWFGWESLVSKDQFWTMVTGAALAYAIWTLFLRYRDPAEKKPGNPPPGDGDGKPGA